MKKEQNTVKLYIIPRSIKTAKSNRIVIYIRVIYKRMSSEVNSGVSVTTLDDLNPQNKHPYDFDKKTELIRVSDLLKSYYHELDRNGILKHPSQICDAFRGRPVSGMYFLTSFDEFIINQETEVKGGNLSKGTMKNYYTTQKFLKRFVKEQFKRNEIPMSMFDRHFLDLFFGWLVNNTTSTNNGRSKHFERIKRFTTVSIDYGHIDKSPFSGFKIKKTVNPRMYLTEEEVCRIREVDLPKENWCISRDMFLLMCNTGLAFSDLYGLDENTIETSVSGKVIRGKRIKTKTSFMVPLTLEAQAIIEKYSHHRIAKQKKSLLPVFSNQTFNKHLKLIGKAAKIDKELTSHVGRHSFATTALTAGVPLVTIQRTLGHSDLRMTLHYSRLIDKKLEEDMNAFKLTMDKQTNQDNQPSQIDAKHANNAIKTNNNSKPDEPRFRMRAV